MYYIVLYMKESSSPFSSAIGSNKRVTEVWMASSRALEQDARLKKEQSKQEELRRKKLGEQWEPKYYRMIAQGKDLQVIAEEITADIRKKNNGQDIVECTMDDVARAKRLIKANPEVLPPYSR